MKKVLLWLDDFRDPSLDPRLYYFNPDHLAYEIVWVKSYNEFCAWITDNGLPTKISFDHDLHDEHYAPPERWEDYNDWSKEQNFKEKTGMDCVNWLVDYCLDNNALLPTWVCHTANPAGRVNMASKLMSFMKFQTDNGIIS